MCWDEFAPEPVFLNVSHSYADAHLINRAVYPTELDQKIQTYGVRGTTGSDRRVTEGVEGMNLMS